MIPLVICTVTSSALVSALYLPWFGISTTDPIPHYSAVAPELVPPATSPGVAPGTQKWGYLLLTIALLVAALGVISLIACVRSRSHQFGGPSWVLLFLAVASLPLVPLVILEMTATVNFGDQPLGYDWGAIIGGLLAVFATSGAWFAWATNRYRWLWP